MSPAKIYISKTASCLPFDPIGNDQMEAVLGCPGGIPSRARRITLRSNGITSRHYVVDPETGRCRMTNAQMTAEAVRGLEACGFDLRTIECLVSGTGTPDQTMPSHGVMVHGALGGSPCEVVTTTANCLAGVTALKYGWMSLATGNVRNAVVTGSEVASLLMHARNFEAESAHRVNELQLDPGIAFEKDFLRWMLSDGAGAVLLETAPRPGIPALEVEWIDLFSFSNEMPVCMYSGAERGAEGDLVGWMNLEAEERSQRSLFAIKQDVKLLNENIIKYTLVEPLRELTARRGLSAQDVDWFLPHMSSCFFRPALKEGLEAAGLPIPEERWFTNLTTCGNTGAASIFIMLDELVRSGRLRNGQRLLCFVPESARFSSSLFSLRVVL